MIEVFELEQVWCTMMYGILQHIINHEIVRLYQFLQVLKYFSQMNNLPLYLKVSGGAFSKVHCTAASSISTLV